MFLGGAVVGAKRLRRGTNAPAPKVESDAGGVGLASYFVQRGVIEPGERIEVGDEQGIAPDRGGVGDESGSLPAHGANGEVVDPEGELWSRGARSGGEWLGPGREGSGGEAGKEGAAVHRERFKHS